MSSKQQRLLKESDEKENSSIHGTIIKSALSKQGQQKFRSPLANVTNTNIPRKSPFAQINLEIKAAKADHAALIKVTEQAETEWSMLYETILDNENQLTAQQFEIDRLNGIILEKEVVESEKDHTIVTLEQKILRLKEDYMNQRDAKTKEVGLLREAAKLLSTVELDRSAMEKKGVSFLQLQNVYS